jgi:hypothetical protein
MNLITAACLILVSVATTARVMKIRRRSSNPVKFGFDIHGVIDAMPDTFAELTKTLVAAGHEVHILTGSMWKPEIEDQLKGYGVVWTHKFSISDYRIAQNPDGVTFDENGNPWMPADLWDSAKSEYCRENEISLHLDDTKRYNDFFTTPFARVWTHNNRPKGEHRDTRHID